MRVGNRKKRATNRDILSPYQGNPYEVNFLWGDE
jgi:hypothetical protein